MKEATAQKLAQREIAYMKLLVQAEAFLAMTDSGLGHEHFPTTQVTRGEGPFADLKTLGYTVTITFNYWEKVGGPYGWLLMDVVLPRRGGVPVRLCRWFVDEFGNLRVNPDIDEHAATYSIKDKNFLVRLLDEVQSRLFELDPTRDVVETVV